MEISFILLILGFLVVTFLIFKFIKKIFVAIFSFIFLIILIIGGVVGLAVLDINNLASQNDFNTYIIYGSSDNPYFGFEIPVENKTPILEKSKPIKVSSLDKETYEDSEKDFYIFISKDIFEKIIQDNKKYYLIGTKDLEISSIKIDTSLTKDEILSLLNSTKPIDLYSSIIYSQNNFPSILGDTGEAMVKEYIEKDLGLTNEDLKAVILISIIEEESDNPNLIPTILEGYKNGEIEIYKDRFTFKLVRMIPIDLIMEYIPEDSINLEEIKN